MNVNRSAGELRVLLLRIISNSICFPTIIFTSIAKTNCICADYCIVKSAVRGKSPWIAKIFEVIS